MKNKVDTEHDHDFGFHFADDVSSEVDAAKDKAQKLYDAIIPFLNNLKKNPDKPNIVWPDRVKKIDIFIKKLDNILNQ